jgi:hypothetical protein
MSGFTPVCPFSHVDGSESPTRTRFDLQKKNRIRRIHVATTPFTFTDMSNAIAGYPALSVTLTIDSPVQKSGVGGTSVNINEIWGFKVKIKNTGNLNMTNVKLRIAGQNNVKVGATYPPSAAGYLNDQIVEDVLDVPVNTTLTTKEFYFQAPSKDSAIKKIDLVRVTIDDWDADLTYILTNLAAHTDPPFATYSATVLPQ